MIALIVPVWGLVGDLMGPAVSAAIADMVDEELRVEAYALGRVVSNLAFAVGPPLGALIALVSSLRWTFVVAGAGCLVYFAIVWFRVPETRPDHVEHHGGQTRLGAALRDRKLVALGLASALATYVYVQWTDVGGLFLLHDRGYAAATWGLCFGINPILVAVGQYPLAGWARRRSHRVILAAGAILQGLGLAMLLPGSPLPWVIASVVVFTLGEMLIAPIATALAASLAPVHLRGSYQGVLNFAFAGAFGPAVFIGVALVGAGDGAWMLGLALPLSILAAALTWPLPSKPFAAEGDRGLAPA